jgi:formylglycine-generating enzyme required for sulfatase activity
MDMSGNVYNWTSTIYQDYPYHVDDRHEDVTNAGARRVVRGGSWFHDQTYARAAYRGFGDPTDRDNITGFRLARTPNL